MSSDESDESDEGECDKLVSEYMSAGTFVTGLGGLFFGEVFTLVVTLSAYESWCGGWGPLFSHK